MHRKLLAPIVASLMLLLSFTVTAQSTSEDAFYCAQEQRLAQLLGANPQLLARHLAIENSIYNDTRNGLTRDGSRAGVLYTLPVVVHIIHNNGAENISDAQVLQGIADLNEAFANTGYYDPATGVNTQIQFCLAKRDPNGQLTTGITRNVSPLTTMDINTQDIPLKNLNRWNPYCYINIWLVKSICDGGSCSIGGYAYFPSAHGSNLDGIVCLASYFGQTQARSSVQVHEMGHYLGLYHTFQSGCTNTNCLQNGDKVCDTPPDNATGYYTCGATVNTCNTDALSGFTTDEPDMYQAYMDYGNLNCMSIFTQGQTDRMQWHVANVRSSLLGCQSCVNPCANPAIASFTSGSTTVGIGGTVSFTNTSTNATAYTWWVNGVQFATTANASYLFNNAGVYVVKLRADNSNPDCFDEFTDTITVTCPVSAGFTQSAFQILPGQSVTFTSNSTGATTYSWMIDGVQVSTNTTYTHTFNQSGDYSVYLIASNGQCADTTSIINFVHVGSGCNAYFTHTPTAPAACSPVNFIPDTTCHYSNYFWSFCDFDAVGQPAIQDWSTQTYGSSKPAGVTLMRDENGNYHAFWPDYDNLTDSTRYYRADFGNSMANTPVVHKLYITGITDTRNHSISIIQVDGIYYAFMINNIKAYRAVIGPDITNNSFAAAEVGGLGTVIGWGHEIQAVRETNNFWLIMCDRNNGHIIIAYLGNNIMNNVLQYNTYRKNVPNEQYFAFQYIRSKGKSHIFATDFNNGITRFDFGISLGNTPTTTNLGQFGSGLPLDINLFQNCNGSFDGYLVKENSTDHKVLHWDSVTAMPTITYNFPANTARIAGLSSFLVTDMGVTCMAVMAYTQKLLRLNFGTCNSTNAYSTEQFPPPVSFTTPGTRYVRLLVDQGLPTESSYCQAVTVTGVNTPPLNLGPDISLCPGNSAILHAGPWYNSYTWTGGYTDSVYTVYQPGIYSATVTDYCGNTFTDTVRVSVDSTKKFSLQDTLVCAGAAATLQGPPGFTSYQWLPTTGLGCPTCQVTTATPVQSTVYTLQVTSPGGCTLIANTTVDIALCTGTGTYNADANRIRIVPNPASSMVTITIPDGMVGSLLTITDVTGRKVAQQQLNTSTLQVPVETLANGVYTVTVLTQQKSVTRKLLISR
ncbi:MAG TPA: M43 family zinc metalloprotease [Chitinophagales bacterium]|nr:M43 family zinc metalloprotease [Chitinophagales bacterium]